MESLFGKSWLTSLGGIIAALGGLVTLLPKSLNIDPQWSVFVVGLGGAIAGFGAKSFNVHSTEEETKASTKQEVLKDDAKIRGIIDN